MIKCFQKVENNLIKTRSSMNTVSALNLCLLSIYIYLIYIWLNKGLESVPNTVKKIKGEQRNVYNQTNNTPHQ
jgi:hypothetical protein